MAQPTPSSLAPSSLAQWAGAVATFLAVGVALFKNSVLRWWRKPSLDAICTKESPWTVRPKTTVYNLETHEILWRGETYYVRVEVVNSGKTRAEKVQVYASKLAKQELDGKFKDVEGFIPLNLKWANSPVGGPVVVLDGISPRMGAFCDVVCLCPPDNPHQARPTGAKEDVTIGQLQLEVEPTNELHLLEPGKYRVTLRIAAANVKPIEKLFTFRHTGQWLQDDSKMRSNCLEVSLT